MLIVERHLNWWQISWTDWWQIFRPGLKEAARSIKVQLLQLMEQRAFSFDWSIGKPANWCSRNNQFSKDWSKAKGGQSGAKLLGQKIIGKSRIGEMCQTICWKDLPQISKWRNKRFQQIWSYEAVDWFWKIMWQKNTCIRQMNHISAWPKVLRSRSKAPPYVNFGWDILTGDDGNIVFFPHSASPQDSWHEWTSGWALTFHYHR